MQNALSLRVSILLFVISFTFGCGGQVTVDSARSSQVSYDEALTLVNSGSYSQALPLLNKAIESGGLSADIYADALLLRSRCYCDAGDLEKGEADLSHAEQGTPNPAQFEIAKGTLLFKKGKKAEADAAFKAAKKIDKSAVIPKL